ncbi:MAG TPA: hypothetical protein VHE35_23255 [Kofleriaceae bacterium]|nr:hypothetical protein [Kofleriaceae bacterium]
MGVPAVAQAQDEPPATGDTTGDGSTTGDGTPTTGDATTTGDGATGDGATGDGMTGVKPENVTVHDTGAGGPSSEASQDRTFPGTRFWKLDKGKKEIEVWFWRRELERKETDKKWGDGFSIVQFELEQGISKRVQMDVYENLTNESGDWSREGTQIEFRIAYDPVYNRTPLNPVLYLEWHPIHLGPARAEARLLLGQEVLSDKVLAAANLFYEQNVTKSPDEMGGKIWIPNPEMGVTGGLSYAVSGQKLRIGAEMKLAFEKDLWSDDRFSKQLLVGPNISTRLAGEKLKMFITTLFGVTDDARRFDGFVVLASGF